MFFYEAPVSEALVGVNRWMVKDAHVHTSGWNQPKRSAFHWDEWESANIARKNLRLETKCRRGKLAMIGTTLEFVRTYLDAALKREMGGSLEDGASERVVFPPANQAPGDSVSFASGKITLLLANLEEEKILRGDDPYRRLKNSGGWEVGPPEIRLVLYLLFVARHSNYADSWNQLSALLRQLNAIKVLERESAPTLPEGIQRLAFELVSQSFGELNDVWNALRTTHHPSLLYRVRLLSIRESQTVPALPVTEQVLTARPWSGR